MLTLNTRTARNLPLVAAGIAALAVLPILPAHADAIGGITSGTDWLITLIRASFVAIIILTLWSLREGHNIMSKIGLTVIMMGGIAEAPTIAGWFG
jgi:hypothetical protein